jgi:mono/diheme cytochrome c family protein
MKRLFFVILLLLLTACGEEENSSPADPTLDPDTPAGRGAVLFVEAQCSTCHAVKGDRQIVGPSLDGIATHAAERVPGQSAEDYLTTSILQPDEHLVEGFQPGSMKQDFALTLTFDQVEDLVAYLMTLN